MLVVIGIVVVALIGWLVLFNRLVGLKNRAIESWSGIDVQLKRRYDLVPNLVEVVKGYAAHERDTLENVVRARNAAMTASGGDKSDLEKSFGGSITGLLALKESYPDLKANQNFLELQKALVEVEDNLQNARRYYNAVVRDLNNACETFPSMFVARSAGIQKRSFFEAGSSERDNVSVSMPGVVR